MLKYLVCLFWIGTVFGAFVFLWVCIVSFLEIFFGKYFSELTLETMAIFIDCLLIVIFSKADVLVDVILDE